MTKVEQFLNKLSKVEWHDADSDSLQGKTESGSEIKFSIDVKLANSYHDMDAMPTQVVVRVVLNGHYVASWGATDSKDNTKLVTFFRERQAKAQNQFHALQSKHEKSAKAEFEKL